MWGTLSLTPLSLPSPWVYVAGSKLHRFCDFGFRGLSQPLTEADTAPLVSLGLTGFRATVGGGRGGGVFSPVRRLMFALQERNVTVASWFTQGDSL